MTSGDVAQKILDVLEEADLTAEQDLEALRDVVAVVLCTAEFPVSVFTESLEERMDDVVACEELFMSTEVGEA